MPDLATILVVNDDDVSRYAVSRILQNAGFHVLEAASGAEAFERVAERPDLIVLDVQLPDISGFEVCRRLKADPATTGIAVLHLSASFVGSQDRAYGLEGGADGYLTQPVEPPVLVAHIKALLRMRRAEASAQEQAIQWQTTFDAISDCIFLLDARGRIIQCNQAMAQLLAQTAGSLRGRLLAEVMPDATLPSVADSQVSKTTEVKIGDRWFYVTADPLPSSQISHGSVYAMTDITKRKHAEDENLRLLLQTQESTGRQRAFMRDILNSVTEGRLCLCDDTADIPPPLPVAGESVPLTAAALSVLRRAARTALDTEDFPSDRASDLITAVSEAGMNAVVHAGGGVGRVSTDPTRHVIQVRIEDRGTGIAVDRLPRATLQRGYTTAGSLGQGFKMILQTVDRVWLLTGTTGTTIVLEQERQSPGVLQMGE